MRCAGHRASVQRHQLGAGQLISDPARRSVGHGRTPWPVFVATAPVAGPSWRTLSATHGFETSRCPQNVFDANIFGFWPDGAAGASNPRTGTSASVGFRREPERRPAVRFFTISGGNADTKVGGEQCRFNPAAAVKAQLNVAIDHLSTFTNTGAIMNTMLSSSCTGTGCCAGYSGACDSL